MVMVRTNETDHEKWRENEVGQISLTRTIPHQSHKDSDIEADLVFPLPMVDGHDVCRFRRNFQL